MHVRLGVTTAQDLLSDLGPPLRTFYKEDDRMAIHARGHTEDESPEPSCTSSAFLVLPYMTQRRSSDFYNYFQHGIDFLLSDHTHIVKKIILHSNVVCTFLLLLTRSITSYSYIAGYTPLPTVQAMRMADRRST